MDDCHLSRSVGPVLVSPGSRHFSAWRRPFNVLTRHGSGRGSCRLHRVFSAGCVLLRPRFGAAPLPRVSARAGIVLPLVRCSARARIAAVLRSPNNLVAVCTLTALCRPSDRRFATGAGPWSGDLVVRPLVFDCRLATRPLRLVPPCSPQCAFVAASLTASPPCRRPGRLFGRPLSTRPPCFSPPRLVDPWRSISPVPVVLRHSSVSLGRALSRVLPRSRRASRLLPCPRMLPVGFFAVSGLFSRSACTSVLVPSESCQPHGLLSRSPAPARGSALASCRACSRSRTASCVVHCRRRLGAAAVVFRWFRFLSPSRVVPALLNCLDSFAAVEAAFVLSPRTASTSQPWLLLLPPTAALSLFPCSGCSLDRSSGFPGGRFDRAPLRHLGFIRRLLALRVLRPAAVRSVLLGGALGVPPRARFSAVRRVRFGGPVPRLLQPRYRVPVVSSPWLSRGSAPPSSCGGSFGVVTVVALFPALRILAIRRCCRDPTGVNLRVDPDVCTFPRCTSFTGTRFACQFGQLLRFLHYVHVHALERARLFAFPQGKMLGERAPTGGRSPF